MSVKTKKSRNHSMAGKKRQGNHHTQGKHYLKVYWPYVPMLLIVMVGIFFGTPRDESKHGVLAYATEMSSQELLQNTNEERRSYNKTPLSLNGSLTAAAQAKAQDMATRNYWSHNTPDGREPWHFVQEFGYSYKKAGENLAYGFASSDETVNGWMNSKTHRENLLDESFREVGFGFVNVASFNNSGKETVVVAMYGQPKAEEFSANSASKDDTVVAGTNKSIPSNNSNGTLADVSQPVTRLQSITKGNAPWIAFAVGLLSGAALLFVSVKHSLAFKRALIHGEQFFLAHPLLDIALVGVVMIGYVLSQTTGFIQ